MKQETKKAELDLLSKDNAICEKFSLDVELVKEHPDDVRLAELLKYSTVQCKGLLCILGLAYFFSLQYSLTFCKEKIII